MVAGGLLAIIISVLYMYNRDDDEEHVDVSFEWLPIIFPLTFGMFNAFSRSTNILLRNKYLNSFMIDAIIGTLFTIIGSAGMSLPAKFFNQKWLLYIIAFVIYGSVFSLIIWPLNNYLNDTFIR